MKALHSRLRKLEQGFHLTEKDQLEAQQLAERIRLGRQRALEAGCDLPPLEGHERGRFRHSRIDPIALERAIIRGRMRARAWREAQCHERREGNDHEGNDQTTH